jgi:hypothetical protein
MRQLILHIGPGKSGSSALQSWLALNQEHLSRLGYGYHVGHEAARNFRVNAGNAGPLREMLGEAALPAKHFEHRYFQGHPHAIISGEQLQLLERPSAERLLAWAGDAAVAITVVGVLRNVYDYFYSTWLQTIKRRNQAETFATFVERRSRFRHLDVVEHWEGLTRCRWMHYDTERNRLAEAFCDRAGLDVAALEPMSPRRVNRSLTPEEADVLQALVRRQRDAGLEVRDDFSRIISDELVDEDPDRPVGFRFEERAHAHMVDTFEGALQGFNETVGARERMRLAVLGETRYLPSSAEEGLDGATLTRIAKVIVARRDRFGAQTLAVIAASLAAEFPEVAETLAVPDQ